MHARKAWNRRSRFDAFPTRKACTVAATVDAFHAANVVNRKKRGDEGVRGMGPWHEPAQAGANQVHKAPG